MVEYLFDDVDRLGSGDRVVGATFGYRKGFDGAVLLGDVEPVVGAKLDRGGVVEVRSSEACSIEILGLECR